MNSRIPVCVGLILSLAIAAIASFKIQPAQAEDHNDARSPWPIVVVADLQRTSLLERFFGRENNLEIQTRLFEHLRQSSIGHTILIGDVVFHPRSADDWSRFGELTHGLPDMHIALGNHDYPCFLGFLPCSRQLTGELTARFPHLLDSRGDARTSCAYQLDDIGIVLLDTERKNELEEQLDEALAQLSAASAILIFAHRPPFTNAKGLFFGPDSNVRAALAKATSVNSRIVAVFSGHAHGYERFWDDDTRTHYVVTAGGGGPRREYREAGDDLYCGKKCPKDRRPFNYVVLEKTSEGLVATTFGICKTWRAFKPIDRFTIGVPTAQENPLTPVPCDEKP